MNLQSINKEKTKLNPIEFIARLGVFGTFMGHGIVAIGVNPKWIPLLTSFGFSEEQAVFLMPLIGILDIIVAMIILIYPIRIVLYWAVFWAILTALSRPISGESFLEFFERSSNWGLPLVLLMMKYYKKNQLNQQLL
jgi:hypothetical protein